LRPSPQPLVPAEAIETGDWFRERIATLLRAERV
jgi:hypothetical protein